MLCPVYFVKKQVEKAEARATETKKAMEVEKAAEVKKTAEMKKTAEVKKATTAADSRRKASHLKHAFSANFPQSK